MPIMINCFCHLISFGISGCLVLGNFQNTHVLADISTSLMPDILSFFPILWLNLASVIVSEHAISIVCSQGLINCLSQDLASSPAAVVRFALYSWTTSYSSTLFLFPVSVLCTSHVPSLFPLSMVMALCLLQVCMPGCRSSSLALCLSRVLTNLISPNLFCTIYVACFSFS